ncbi:ferredoxin [Cryptosporangium japonicum]|uniref:ferredoxin n=1 Tax=Cryptosporangium japonicum TaxID=80872 RepID=UPI0031DCC39B
MTAEREWRITADPTVCIGSGSCVLAAPHTFDQDDEGTVVVLQPTPDENHRAAALTAVGACPVRAITT